MSEKIPYQNINSKEPKVKQPVKIEKFTWPWFPNEKKIIIVMMILFWGYVFLEFLLKNLELSNQIVGLSDGYFGFKKVIFFF